MPTASTAETVVTPSGPVTAVNNKRKTRWTADMNLFFIDTFLRIINCGRIQVGYRERLDSAFICKHPQYSHLAEQNIADRRAAIIRNKLLLDAIIQDIKVKINRELQTNNTVIESYEIQTITQTHETSTNTDTSNQISNNVTIKNTTTENSKLQKEIQQLKETCKRIEIETNSLH